MANIIGIDLGTTVSAIAYINSVAKAEIIPNSDGERLTPSVCLFKEGQNSLLVGIQAKNSSAAEPQRVAKEFKRKMDDPNWVFSVDDKNYSASELSSIILKKLSQDASAIIGEIKDVVISVPAYFKEAQRNSTIEAGKLAGLNVIGIINEPTAAALYYASCEPINGTGLIYDLGGGTFDITLLNICGKNVDILASAGDAFLGGIDFDRALLKIMRDKYEQETGEQLYITQEDEAEFLLRAEEIKKKLSAQDSVKEKLKGEGKAVVVNITRGEFDESIADYIAKTELLTQQVLKEKNLSPQDIDYVLLVGGSTRIPTISESIKRTIGKEPIIKVNVDEAVALGAAIKAGLITIAKSPNSVNRNIAREFEDIRVSDVANHSYGVIVVDSKEERLKNMIIIHKNSKLPSSIVKKVYTMIDNQTSVNIQITQGEDEDPEFVDKIHEEDMMLPAGRPKSQPIEVTYSYDENQVMHCLFVDINSNTKTEIRLNLKSDIAKKRINLDKLDVK